MRMGTLLGPMLALVAGPAWASGELVPEQPDLEEPRITDHVVNVTVNNGFARTEVVQTFDNPNDRELQATYRFPLPRSASLSEMVVQVGGDTLHGEVVGADRALATYDSARAAGEHAALAVKNGHTDFQFAVARIPAGEDAVVRFVYYQPLELDTGVGRWVYPLEPGGNDEGQAFWTSARPAGDITVNVELKSAWPVAGVRMPGWDDRATVDRLDTGHLKVTATVPDHGPGEDLVFYYRLEDDLPGRVELIPYKPSAGEPGTFMLVVTPGADLAPIEGGIDTVFVLDVSGSMGHTLSTLGDAVARSLGELREQDRFRIVVFSNHAEELVPWTPATSVNVADTSRALRGLNTRGGTNLYNGLEQGLRDLAEDRPTQLVLVTDAVANEGEVRPARFAELLSHHDVRMFCFMLGNSGNWPLMNVMTDATGGYATGVSNADDILGQILLAKSKLSHTAMHDARLTVRGLETKGVTDEYLGKVFRGEQLVVFGRYDSAGTAKVALDARISGELQSYTTTVELPAVATDNPELERLWALRSVEVTELARDRGELAAESAAGRIRQLGVDYQLVTDETSMVALTDGSFAERGIERRNQARTAVEHAAQDQRAPQPPQSHVADRHKPAFPVKAPSLGGGAIDPLSGGLALALGGLALWRRRTR